MKVSTWGGSVFACLTLGAGCQAPSSTLQLSDHVRVEVPADWEQGEDRGRTVLRPPRGTARIDVSAAARLDHGEMREPTSVLAALETQVRAFPGAQILAADASGDRIRLEWSSGDIRRTHWAVFLSDSVVHVSCVGLAPGHDTCDAIANSVTGPAPSPVKASTDSRPPRPHPVLPAPELPVALVSMRPRANTRMSEYVAGAAARAQLIEARRLAGTELVP